MLGSCGMPTAERNVFTMDTCFSVQISGKDAEPATKQIEERLNQLHTTLDAYSETGMLYQLNHSGMLTDNTGLLLDLIAQTKAMQAQYGSAVQLSCLPLVQLWNLQNNPDAVPADAVIRQALAWIDDTAITIEENRITLPEHTALDCGAVGKGYALDLVAEDLQTYACDFAIVDATSSILLYGQKPDATPFSIQISDPNGTSALGMLTIAHDSAAQATFLGTSNHSERYAVIDGVRYGHIFDLETGYPAVSDLATVTVIADNGLLADFLSTAIFIEGTNGLSAHLKTDAYAVLAVAEDGTVYHSAGLDFQPIGG